MYLLRSNGLMRSAGLDCQLQNSNSDKNRPSD
uniref:Uncharacterized protein n=1 Tax=Ascaris lumbricoides TaxID=6252 RepID=A0A0M3HL74_ASCLU